MAKRKGKVLGTQVPGRIRSRQLIKALSTFVRSAFINLWNRLAAVLLIRDDQHEILENILGVVSTNIYRTNNYGTMHEQTRAKTTNNYVIDYF
jgi:hypothetical protein